LGYLHQASMHRQIIVPAPDGAPQHGLSEGLT